MPTSDLGGRLAAPWQSRFPFQALVSLAAVMLACFVLVATLDVEIKYKAAMITAVAGCAVLAAFPERLIACVLLWVFIHPLSVEKVFYVDAAEGSQFSDPTIVFNASDGPLALLALFLAIETMYTGRLAFRWSRLATILFVFLIWSTLSYTIHRFILSDGLTNSAPLALLQSARLLLFVVLVQSAIRSRGDVILVLLAVGTAVLLQTVTVGLSYVTGSVFSYAAATGVAGGGALQPFNTSGGGELLRATGTFGQVNEQAIFHTFMTLPLIAFLAARSNLVRSASLGVVAASALALVLTFSRGAWLAFPVGVVVCGIVALRRGLLQRTAVLIGAVLAVGAIVAGLFLAQPIYERLAYGDTGATAARVRMLLVAADLFGAFPIIGVGPGEFNEAALGLYPPGFEENRWQEPWAEVPVTTIGRVEISEVRAGNFFIRRPLPVHNKYMLTLSELGLPGLLIWLWFCAEFVQLARRCSKLPDRLLSVFGIAGIGVAASLLVYMMVEHFHDDKPLEVVLLVPVLLLAASRARAARASGVLHRSVSLQGSGFIRTMSVQRQNAIRRSMPAQLP